VARVLWIWWEVTSTPKRRSRSAVAAPSRAGNHWSVSQRLGAEHVRRHHAVAAGVEELSRPDEAAPPATAAVCGGRAGGVMAAGGAVGLEDHVVARWRQFAVGLAGDLGLAQRAAERERKRTCRSSRHGLDSCHSAASLTPAIRQADPFRAMSCEVTIWFRRVAAARLPESFASPPGPRRRLRARAFTPGTLRNASFAD
jgi:hypothetical protein